MKTTIHAAILALMISGAAMAAEDPGISVSRPGDTPQTQGSAQLFSGEVLVGQLFRGTAPATISGGVVSFNASARTAWHTHPLGQTLYVISGNGRVQQWGKPVQEMKTGDIVLIPPGVKHWHGASATSAMSHLAFAEQLDGKVVTWMELVSDAQYLSEPSPK
ncbi:cupin domain-containing protein [Rhodoferax sp. U11-2br]|uniref:(R)-mandelonitrile lyase n=1 Tax=Rhodoferax sp. U11-2br TaxID=2838878 RepID=UPI001BE7664F|nr:cupin domain-containing protein [Rhodoferax sp. U11-2br]MBT3069155.1 cupin domain-containing protein [Rhodoferax sp. U11-2br]